MRALYFNVFLLSFYISFDFFLPFYFFMTLKYASKFPFSATLMFILIYRFQSLQVSVSKKIVQV